ncbi:MAG: phosphonopyruvate decarboxylase [Clostridia bacterium]|nr:phosphonopyruvate decarboxylase [Clostridia bacterium]
MYASVLLDACREAGIDFFTGVPDSLLKALCNELYARYGTDSDVHVVAHNEGGAIALCAGHYLASGRPALCYMQNSGLGNAVNPLASLMDPEVYALPCLLVVGWRGEPGVKDEPQHKKQGVVTLGQLDLLGIPYRILSQDTSDEAFLEDFRDLYGEMKRGKTAAIVVRKGALQSDCKPVYGNQNHMTREAAAGLILSASGKDDVFVSTTGKLSREVFELRESRGEGHSRDFLTVGSMGHASMIAMRIAVEKSGKRVWCLDGDGASLMHLGALQMIGKRLPANLVHVVINNGAHETVGGMPVCSGSMDIASLASAAGYPSVFTADSEEALLAVLKDSLPAAPGPVLVEVRCACGSRSDLGRPTTTPIDNRDAFMRFLQK